jgi:hypothetical protein
MAEDSKKLIFGVGMDAADFQDAINKLKSLEQAAKGVADAFSKALNGGAEGGSNATNGVANPTPVGGATGTAAGGAGRYSTPLLIKASEVNTKLKEYIPILKDYAKEYRELLDVMSKPLPAGAAANDILGALKRVGGAGGGRDGAPPTPPPPDGRRREERDDDGGDGRGDRGSKKWPNIIRSLADIANATDRLVEKNNFASLDVAAGRASVAGKMYGEAMRGDISSLVALQQMGGYQAVLSNYGMQGYSQTSPYVRAALGVGLAGTGLAGAFGTGGIGALLTASSITSGTVMAGDAIIDILSGKGSATAQERVVQAIDKFKQANPIATQQLHYYQSMAPGIAEQSRRYEYLRGGYLDSAESRVREQQEALAFGGRSRFASEYIPRGADRSAYMQTLNSLMERMPYAEAQSLAQQGFGTSLYGFSPSLMQQAARMAEPRRGNATETLVDLAARAQAYGGSTKMIEPAFQSIEVLSSMNRLGPASLMGQESMLGRLFGGEAPTTAYGLELRTQAIQGVVQGGRNPYAEVSRLINVRQTARELGISLTYSQAKLISQLAPHEYGDISKFKSIGISEDVAKKLSPRMMEADERIQFGALISRESVGGRAIEKLGGLRAAYESGKLTEEEKVDIRTQIAAKRPRTLGTPELAEQALQSYLKPSTAITPDQVEGIKKALRRTREGGKGGDYGAESLLQTSIDAREEAFKSGNQLVQQQLTSVLTELGSVTQSFYQSINGIVSSIQNRFSGDSSSGYYGTGGKKN